MSLLNTTLQTLVVRLRDISGNVTEQKLHNRVFDAYEAKSLVFEAILPEQQALMVQYRGHIPPSHPAGQPILVDSWSDLIAIHNDKNIYQLLPRRAKSNSSYALIKSICCSTGSPFHMDHRVDTTDYKLTFKAADFDLRNQFNANNVDKIPHTIWFDGIIKAPTASALVNFHPKLSNSHVSNLCGSHQFLKEFVKQPSIGDRHRQLKELYTEIFSKPTLLFLGSNFPPNRELVNYAKSKGVFIYSKKDKVFVYQQ